MDLSPSVPSQRVPVLWGWGTPFLRVRFLWTVGQPVLACLCDSLSYRNLIPSHAFICHFLDFSPWAFSPFPLACLNVPSTQWALRTPSKDGRNVQGLWCTIWRCNRTPIFLGNMAALPWDGSVTRSGANTGASNARWKGCILMNGWLEYEGERRQQDNLVSSLEHGR